MIVGSFIVYNNDPGLSELKPFLLGNLLLVTGRVQHRGLPEENRLSLDKFVLEDGLDHKLIGILKKQKKSFRSG